MKKALFSIFFISALLFACSQNDELALDNDADGPPPLQHVTSPNQGENPEKDNGDKTDADNDSDDENDAENNDGQKCVWLQVNYTYRFVSNTSTSTSYSNNSTNWIYYNGSHDCKYIHESQTEQESNSVKTVSTSTYTYIFSENQSSSVSVQKTYAYDLDGNEIPSSSYQCESETIYTYFEETLPAKIVKNIYSNSVFYHNDGRESKSNTTTDYTLEYLGKKNDCNVYKVTRNDDDLYGLYYEYKIKDDMIIELDTYTNSTLSNHIEYSISADEFLAELGCVDSCTYDSNGNLMSTSKCVLINKTEDEAMIDFVTTSSNGESVQSNKFKRFAYPFKN